MATRSIKIEVTDKHIKKGKCLNQNECAVALALRGAGFREVAVYGTKAIVGKKDALLTTNYDSESNPEAGYLTLRLPKKVKTFVERFDSESPSLKPISFIVRATEADLKAIKFKG